jgi:hypothetical protein
MATEQFNPSVKPKRIRRRFLVVVTGSVVLAAGGFCGWLTYRNNNLNRELRAALAEVETADSRWQLEQIEADRAKIPDAENSAIVIARARARIPRRSQSGWARHDELMHGLSPEVRLSSEQYDGMIDELEQVEAAIGPALALARYPRGRHPISIAPDVFSTLLRHFDDCGQVQTQVFDSLLPVLIHEGNFADALDVCRASLNLGRSFGDEQWAGTQCGRTRFAQAAIRGMERVLGQEEIPELALTALQAEFAEEANYDPWNVVMRGQRAEIVRVLEAVEDGRIKPSHFRGWLSTAPAPAQSPVRQAQEWITDRLGQDTRSARTKTLRYFTRLIHAGGLPWPERRVAAEAISASETGGLEPVWLIGLQLDRLVVIFQSAQARGRCAVAAIAAERFRLRYGRWPDSLAALVPEFLPAVATDPFDGQALRYKKLADGSVIYSIGPGPMEVSGKVVDAKPWPAGTDLSFRLWDVSSRGQEPRSNR